MYFKSPFSGFLVLFRSVPILWFIYHLGHLMYLIGSLVVIPILYINVNVEYRNHNEASS